MTQDPQRAAIRALKATGRPSDAKDQGGELVAQGERVPMSAKGDLAEVGMCASTASGLLRQGVTQSGIELFAAYGIDFRPASGPPGDDTTVSGASQVSHLAFAGFVGPYLSGSIILGLPERVLQRSNATMSSSGDWVAELANQLLGRIKNRLLRQGIVISRIPPAVVASMSSSLLLGRAGQPPVALSDAWDSVLIWLQSEPSVESTDTLTDSDRDVLTEGDMILF